MARKQRQHLSLGLTPSLPSPLKGEGKNFWIALLLPPPLRGRVGVGGRLEH
jgi:hypothetical protein